MSPHAVAVLLTYYYPHVMMVVFLAFLLGVEMPAKGRFFCHAMAALLIATFFAHLNRWFNLWPEHYYFASGHMTFCLGLAISLGLLRFWTLAVTLPLLIPFGMALVTLHFHLLGDVLGAVPIVLVVYGLIHFNLLPHRSIAKSAYFLLAPLDSNKSSLYAQRNVRPQDCAQPAPENAQESRPFQGPLRTRTRHGRQPPA